MSLIRIENAHLSYGLQILLDGVDLEIAKGQRLCLIGRNGAGKSSLLKVLAGEVELDRGEVIGRSGLQIARLEQDLPTADNRRVFDVVAGAFAELGEMLAEYHSLALAVSDEDAGARMMSLQQKIEAADGWALQRKVEEILSRLDLPSDRYMRELSGGWRRRVALAKALVLAPDLLLLDEPTNHLDIAAIQWLEKQLLTFTGALVFITHDRALLQTLATHIAELDRGSLRYWSGDYASYLAYREQVLADEARQNALFDKKLAQEEVWIRQGIKARRTRNEGRVRALKALREERSRRREQIGNVKLSLTSGELSGRLVAELCDVSYRWGDKVIIDHFSATIMRGDRIGFIGPNGAGKTTLLKLILGQLEPTAGTIKRGTHIQVAYFDQLRDQLDLDKSAVDNVAEGREFIDIDGKNKHVFSYLSDFLFTGERARTPLRALSGGERNRVLLAKLFSKTANLLVLDEPTNDLDIETLELLEEILISYTGTVLLVSHDRAFLNNIVTSVVAFEGQARVKEYVGDYDDWLRQGGQWLNAEPLVSSAKTAVPQSSALRDSGAAGGKKTKKLTYKLQKEFDELPEQIERLEQEISQLQNEIATENFYQQAAVVVEERMQYLANLEQALETCFARWAELEDLQHQ